MRYCFTLLCLGWVFSAQALASEQLAYDGWLIHSHQCPVCQQLIANKNIIEKKDGYFMLKLENDQALILRDMELSSSSDNRKEVLDSSLEVNYIPFIAVFDKKVTQGEPGKLAWHQEGGYESKTYQEILTKKHEKQSKIMRITTD